MTNVHTLEIANLRFELSELEVGRGIFDAPCLSWRIRNLDTDEGGDCSAVILGDKLMRLEEKPDRAFKELFAEQLKDRLDAEETLQKAFSRVLDCGDEFIKQLITEYNSN